MRIAHINMLPNGSTGKIMFGIAEVARKRGYASKTFCPVLFNGCDKEKNEHHVQWGFKIDSFVHAYVGRLLGMNGRLSQVSTALLIKELKKFNPSIIHLHNLHNFSFNLSMLFKYIKRNDIKVVWTLHDCWTFTGHCPYFDMVKCDKWQSECFDCPQKEVYPNTYIDNTKSTYYFKKKLFTGLDSVVYVTPSEWLAGLVKQSFLQEYPVKVINNGIDLSVFRPLDSDVRQRYGINGKYVLLGVAFDWGKRKGLDVFIELSKKLPLDYTIVLVGTDDRIAEQLPSNIVAINRTESQKELAELYSTADLFVNPTREENYPTVNMEALACGTPVVSFDTGGSAEIFDDTCGRVVDCDDIEGLVDSIKDICENRRYTREDCLKKAENFDFKKKFDQYIELYESL